MTTSETATLAIWLIVHTVDVFANRRTGDGKQAGPVSTDNRADAAENASAAIDDRCTAQCLTAFRRGACPYRAQDLAGRHPHSGSAQGQKRRPWRTSLRCESRFRLDGGFYQTPLPHERCQPKPFGLRMRHIDARPATERKMRWRDSGRRTRRERTGARCRVRGADVCPARRKRLHRYRTRLRQTAKKCRPREGP